MSEEKLEQLLKLVKEIQSTSSSDYSKRIAKVEKLLFDLSSFLVNWIFITVQVDKEKYISLIGKEKFEELINAIGDFTTRISTLKEE